MRSSKVVDDGETIGKKGFGVVCGKDTVGSFLLDRRKPRRTMNASECVSKVCALECNFLSPTLKVRDFQMEVKRTPLVDYIEKPQKDVTSLGSLVANVGFGITDEVSSVLKDMVLLASTYSQELIRVCSHINRILDYMEGIGTENMRKARLASLGLQKTISELRSITTPRQQRRSVGVLNPLQGVLKEGQLIVDQGHSHPSSSLLTNILKSSSFTYGRVILESDFSHADPHLNALELLTILSPRILFGHLQSVGLNFPIYTNEVDVNKEASCMEKRD
ncbi:fanconi anemia group D2 protein [Tanacetum coccineum]